jgi:putative two-component system response regulator
LLARILQVVDVYDALRTARPYKPALSHTQAVKTMQDEAHRGLWDPELVDTFLHLIDQQKAA